MEAKLEKMCETFFWKYRDYMFRWEDKEGGLLTCNDIVDFVTKRCPKSILKSKEAIIHLCELLNSVLTDRPLNEDDDFLNDINFYQQLNLKYR